MDFEQGDTKQRRFFTEANPVSSARLRFTIITKNGRLETALELRQDAPMRGQ